MVDYLVEEVLQRLPDDVRDFLMRTCVLRRLNASLCDAITGHAGTSRVLLDRMERQNLFLVPLDEDRQWFADFGDGGVAFVAQPQIPPRNVNWSSSGKWVHAAKVGFEKYFLHKIRSGTSEPFYEKLALQILGIDKLKAVEHDPST